MISHFDFRSTRSSLPYHIFAPALFELHAWMKNNCLHYRFAWRIIVYICLHLIQYMLKKKLTIDSMSSFVRGERECEPLSVSVVESNGLVSFTFFFSPCPTFPPLSYWESDRTPARSYLTICSDRKSSRAFDSWSPIRASPELSRFFDEHKRRV